MSPLRLALLCALGVLLLTPRAAPAGGWWSSIRVDRSIVESGQRVRLDADVDFRSAAAAAQARERGRFHVYLLEGFDDSALDRAMRQRAPRDWWSLGDAAAIRVGEVAVSVSDAGLGRARAAFTVPELAPGPYHVMLCDAGCAEPLADVVPAEGLTVVADPATARVARRVDRLERRVRIQGRRLAGRRAEAGPAAVAARSDRADRGDAGWLVAGALAGALAVLVVRRRRPRPVRDRG